MVQPKYYPFQGVDVGKAYSDASTIQKNELLRRFYEKKIADAEKKAARGNVSQENYRPSSESRTSQLDITIGSSGDMLRPRSIPQPDKVTSAPGKYGYPTIEEKTARSGDYGGVKGLHGRRLKIAQFKLNAIKPFYEKALASGDYGAARDLFNKSKADPDISAIFPEDMNLEFTPQGEDVFVFTRQFTEGELKDPMANPLPAGQYNVKFNNRTKRFIEMNPVEKMKAPGEEHPILAEPEPTPRQRVRTGDPLSIR